MRGIMHTGEMELVLCVCVCVQLLEPISKCAHTEHRALARLSSSSSSSLAKSQITSLPAVERRARDVARSKCGETRLVRRKDQIEFGQTQQ